ncbi:hypothetical protein [Sphingobacterium paludis]|uniref:Uncharacterized protein n=1 Tax=Sphingobacterium paludis TaxID=1476465 RepID=A0A4R7D2T0_9SPHI|nr:hypothetical protein [Sphingobacterium paludis]TDS13915.1 hypothetical protein B0I21_104242 [Sphingobacterium paludis]
MKDDQLDKLFRDRLNDLKVPPSEDIWARIDAELGTTHQALPFWKQSWLRYAAAAVLALSFAALFYNSSDNEIENTVATPIAEMQQPNSVQPIEKQTPKQPLTQQDDKLAYMEKADTAPETAVKKKPSRLTEVALAKADESRESEKLAVELPNVKVAMVEVAPIDSLKSATLMSHKVVEIEPIQPLIDNPEEEESMFASAPATPVAQKGLVAGLLNKISEVVNPDDSKTIHFSNDEEGSLRVDIFNSLVKTRKKHRK